MMTYSHRYTKHAIIALLVIVPHVPVAAPVPRRHLHIVTATYYSNVAAPNIASWGPVGPPWGADRSLSTMPHVVLAYNAENMVIWQALGDLCRFLLDVIHCLIARQDTKNRHILEIKCWHFRRGQWRILKDFFLHWSKPMVSHFTGTQPQFFSILLEKNLLLILINKELKKKNWVRMN